jgi:hypothetical protein
MEYYSRHAVANHTKRANYLTNRVILDIFKAFETVFRFGVCFLFIAVSVNIESDENISSTQLPYDIVDTLPIICAYHPIQ